MNHGHQIIRNKKKLLFFFILIILIFYSNIADSTTVLGALNKVSGKISKIKVEDNNEIPFGTLKIIVRACKKSLPEDPPENSAYIEIWDKKIDKEEKKYLVDGCFLQAPLFQL